MSWGKQLFLGLFLDPIPLPAAERWGTCLLCWLIDDMIPDMFSDGRSRKEKTWGKACICPQFLLIQYARHFMHKEALAVMKLFRARAELWVQHWGPWDSVFKIVTKTSEKASKTTNSEGDNMEKHQKLWKKTLKNRRQKRPKLSKK